VQFHQGIGPEHHIHEPSSYWQKTAAKIALSSELPSTADVVIIGGGITGVASCYWLAQTGLTVALLEATALAYGATGRNGGIVSIGLAESYPAAIARLGHENAQSVLSLTLNSKTLLRQIIAEEEIACDYREPGHVTLALNGDHMEGLARSVRALQADGVNTRLIDRQEVQEFVNIPLGQDIVGGKFTPEVGLVHSSLLVQGLAKASQRYGASICVAKVERVVADTEGVLIYTTNGTVRAGKVIVALNAWTSELVPEVDRLITPVRGQVLAYAPHAPVFTTGMSVDFTDTEEYWQQAIDGTIVLGGCRAIASGRDRGVRENHPTVEVQTALEQVFPRLFPSLGQLPVVQRWAGVMAFTPDYLPIVDQLKDAPNVWVACGFSGHGMVFGMRLGQLLAKAVTSDTLSEELTSFRLDRPTLTLPK
jgi:glycine/D-amino acid oxidase-like deaminating enzyme